MFCPQCGSQVRDDAAFCPECGTGLGCKEIIPEKPSSEETNSKESKPRREAPVVVCILVVAVAAVAAAALFLSGGDLGDLIGQPTSEDDASEWLLISGDFYDEDGDSGGLEDTNMTNTDISASDAGAVADGSASQLDDAEAAAPTSDALFADLDVSVSYQSSMLHGAKALSNQKYVVLHETGLEGSPWSSVDVLEDAGAGMHFIIARDGSVLQCAPIDQIVHHAGAGSDGNNGFYGVGINGDDTVGTSYHDLTEADYGMNSYSIGVQLMHTPGADYPEAQLEALDDLVAYLDAYYAEQGADDAGTIIDHRAWNSNAEDMSAEFDSLLVAYQDHRTHEGF